jgi:hypothetical protein
MPRGIPNKKKAIEDGIMGVASDAGVADSATTPLGDGGVMHVAYQGPTDVVQAGSVSIPIYPFPTAPMSAPTKPPGAPKSYSEELLQIPCLAYAKVVQLGLGVDLLGSRLSLASTRGSILEINKLGVLAISGKNKRAVLIYSSNIKGVEIQTKNTF